MLRQVLMLRMLLLAFVMMIAAVGCSGPRYVDYFPYHDNGVPKPRIALMPVVDSSNSDISWDLSQEFSRSVYYDLMNSGELYVLSPAEIGPAWDKSIDCFDVDLSFTREFCEADFVVALDLIQHEVISCDPTNKGALSPAECHAYNRVLTLAIRARVIDVRREQPRVILYEIIKSNYILTPPYEIVGYADQTFNSPGYSTTPCGIAHYRMVEKIVSRLEDVVRCAR